MAVYYAYEEEKETLSHHGIKGQRWGVRRYQNPDGTLTEAGKRRYYEDYSKGKLNELGIKERDKRINAIERNQLKPYKNRTPEESRMKYKDKVERRIERNVRIANFSKNQNDGYSLVGVLGKRYIEKKPKDLAAFLNSDFIRDYKATERGKTFIENSKQLMKIDAYANFRKNHVSLG